MKIKYSKYYNVIILTLIVLIPTYLKYINETNITIKAGLYFSIYESNPWGYFKYIEFNKEITKEIHHNIGLKVYYPNQANDTKFIIRVIINKYNNERIINYEIDADFTYNGIYEGEVNIPIKCLGVNTLSIILISIENGAEFIFSEQKYQLTI